MTFLRYRPVLNGFVGAPGINTFHCQGTVFPFQPVDIQAFADTVRASYQSFRANLATGVTVDFPSEVTEHDEASGALVAAYGITAPAQVLSSGAGTASQLSRDTQIVLRLNTGTVRAGRRLKGRLFIGPINSGCILSTGQISSAVGAQLVDAFDGLIDFLGGRLVVYGPPKRNEAGAIVSAGVAARVTGMSYQPMPGTLRSRKS